MVERGLKKLTYNDIEIFYSDELEENEVINYVKEELKLHPQMRLQRVDVTIDKDGYSVFVKPYYNTVTRIRRITGYLSSLPNFNDAKRAEERDRVSHFGSREG